MHRKTEWPGHLQPGKEAMPAIPNPQHSTFNQHARTSFIHLPNTNDQVLQARDPIHARQDLVLAVALGEDDGALATDVDDGAIS
jgi:hypothetical protein